MTSLTPSAATLQAIYTLPDEVRCMYSSKNCPHHRAVKDNGDLHKLCDLHRKKANINQQRMQERRKLMRQKMLEAKQQYLDSTSSSPSSSLRRKSAAAPAAASPTVKIEGLVEPCPSPCGSEFSEEDLRLLELVLFDADEMDSDSSDVLMQSIDVGM